MTRSARLAGRPKTPAASRRGGGGGCRRCRLPTGRSAAAWAPSSLHLRASHAPGPGRCTHRDPGHASHEGLPARTTTIPRRAPPLYRRTPAGATQHSSGDDDGTVDTGPAKEVGVSPAVISDERRSRKANAFGRIHTTTLVQTRREHCPVLFQVRGTQESTAFSVSRAAATTADRG